MQKRKATQHFQKGHLAMFSAPGGCAGAIHSVQLLTVFPCIANAAILNVDQQLQK